MEEELGLGAGINTSRKRSSNIFLLNAQQDKQQQEELPPPSVPRTWEGCWQLLSKAALLKVCVPVAAQGKEGALYEGWLISCPSSPGWCSLLYTLQFPLPCKNKASAAPFLPLHRLSADHVEQMLLPQMFLLSFGCIELKQTLCSCSAHVPAVVYPNLLLTSALV